MPLEPKNTIDVSVVNNDVTEKYRFVIQIPYSLVENSNFLEAMESYKITDPIGWLRALADQVEAITQGETNG